MRIAIATLVVLTVIAGRPVPEGLAATTKTVARFIDCGKSDCCLEETRQIEDRELEMAALAAREILLAHLREAGKAAGDDAKRRRYVMSTFPFALPKVPGRRLERIESIQALKTVARARREEQVEFFSFRINRGAYSIEHKPSLQLTFQSGGLDLSDQLKLSEQWTDQLQNYCIYKEGAVLTIATEPTIGT